MGTYHFKEFLQYLFDFSYLKTIKNGAVDKIFKKKKRTLAEEKKVYQFEESLLGDVLLVFLSGAAIVVGAQLLVDSAISIAQALHISKELIGLSLVAIGTSLPELSVSIAAARRKLGDMVIGNIIGSNVANLSLILGISSLISPLSVSFSMLVSMMPFMFLLSILLLVFIRTGWKINKTEGVIFLLLYVGYIGWQFVS